MHVSFELKFADALKVSRKAQNVRGSRAFGGSKSANRHVRSPRTLGGNTIVRQSWRCSVDNPRCVFASQSRCIAHFRPHTEHHPRVCGQCAGHATELIAQLSARPTIALLSARYVQSSYRGVRGVRAAFVGVIR